MKWSARRAVASSLAMTATFEAALYVSKETPAVYEHAPWLNDPYDTAVSFALFCVPLIIVPSLVRLLASWHLPNREAPERLADLLRASGLACAVVGLTVAACWAAVAAGANRAAWNSVTAVQVGVLALVSAAIVVCGVGLKQAGAALRPDGAAYAPASRPAPDWLGDMFSVALLVARRSGRASVPVTRALEWADHRVLPLVRRHPISAAAVLASAAGLIVTIGQAVSERYGPAVAAAFFCVTTSGVFAFIVIAGWYLHVIRTERPARAWAPFLGPAVLAAAAMPAALAFRAALWSLAGVQPRSGVHQLVLLLAAAAFVAFGAGLAGERIARACHRPAEPPAR